MKRTKKRRHINTARKSKPRLRIFLVFVLVLVSVFYFIYRINFNQYKEFIEDTLSKNINANVSIESLRIHLLTRRALSLHNVSIDDPSDGTSIQAEQIICYVGISQSMRKKAIDFSSISLINPVIKLNRADTPVSELADSSDKIENVDETRQDSESTDKKPWFALESLSFSIQKISIHNGTLEVFDEYSDYFMIDTLNLNAQINHDSIDYHATALMKDTDSERLWAKGHIQYQSKLSITDMIRSFPSAQITSAFSLDTVALHSVYGLNSMVPHQFENRFFSASGDISGIYGSKFDISSRFAFQRDKSQKFIVDVDASWIINEQLIYFNRVISDFNSAGVVADGFYEFKNHYGELYLQTNLMRIEREKDLFPFLRHLDVQGAARVSAIARFSDRIEKPSFSGTIAVESFDSKFDVLAKPLLLTSPCTGTFSTSEITFPRTDMSFGGTPLKLKFRYEFLPEPKIFLSIDEFENFQILEILSASAEQLEKSNPDTEQKKLPDSGQKQTTTGQSAEKTKRKTARSKSSIPIYLSAYMRDAYLYKARFESFYIDSIIEDNRMLYKDIEIRLYEGLFRGNGVITFGQSPDFAFVADLENINIDTFMSRNTSFKDIFYGTLSAAISFQSSGMDNASLINNLTSRGTLSITDGSISNFNLLTKLFEQFTSEENNKYKILGSTIGLSVPPIEELDLGDYSKFNSLRCEYQIHQNDNGITVFEADPMKMDSTSLKMKMSGFFDFDHNLNFDGEMYLSTVQTYKLLHKVRELNLLFPVENERMRIPFKLRGTFEEPIPQPIIKLNTFQNKLDKLIQDKLLQKSEDIEPSLSDIEMPELDEETTRKINKMQKKLKKYLE